MHKRRVVVMAGLSALVLAAGTVLADPASAVRDTAQHGGPAAVSNARAQWSTSTKISLAWTTHGSWATLVTLARGTQPPATPGQGTTVALVKQPRRSITIGNLAPGARYSFALFAKDNNGTYARRVSVGATTAPGPVQRLHAYAEGRDTMLQWADPTPAGTLRRIVVRYAKGRTAPNRPWHGANVALTTPTARTATLRHLAPDTVYSVSVWALDASGRHSTSLATTFTTDEKPVSNGRVAGLVTDTARHPLAHAQVLATDYLTGATGSAVTGDDGRFTLSLPPSDFWDVAVGGQDITGGTSDATGYVAEDAGDAVRAGRTTAQTFRLRTGGAITGRVVDSSERPLAGVPAYVSPVAPYVQGDAGSGVLLSSEDSGSVPPTGTARDGSFTIKGVPDVALQVCFDTGLTTVTGGTAPQYAAACTTRSSLVTPGGSVSAGTTTLAAAVVGTIAGTVSSASGPIAGAVVYFDGTDDDGNGGSGGGTTTDTDGSYSFSGLAPGRYEVCVSAPGATVDAPSGYAPSCVKGTFTVAAGKVTVIDARLRLGAALTGRILGHSGRPLAGVSVLAVPTATGNAPGAGRTDSSGHYTVPGLRAGTYTVCFSTDGVATTASDPTGALPACYGHHRKVAVSAGRVSTGVDAQLAAGAAVAGRLVDAGGHAVAYAEVVAVVRHSDGEAEAAGEAITAPDGRYVLGNLRSGSYHICFDSLADLDAPNGTCRADAVTVRTGHTVHHADGTLPTPSAITVAVHDGGGDPVAGVDAAAIVACTDDDDYACSAVPVFDATKDVAVAASSVTDAAGHVTLGGLEPGHYAVCLFAYYGVTAAGGPDDGYADTCASHRFSVTVTRGRTSAVSLILAPAGAITGRVTDSGGHPLGGVSVHVSGSAADDTGEDTEDDPFLGEPAAGPAPDSVTAADGTYTIRSVTPGAQEVCFEASGATGGAARNGYLDQCQGAAAGSSTGGTPVTVRAGAVTDNGTFALVAAARISGTVATYDGRTSEYGQEVVVFDARARVVGSADRDRPGKYTVGQLAPGTYYVCALAYTYRSQCWKAVAWSDSEKNPPLSRATKLVLGAGRSVTGVDLTLGRD